MTNLQRMRELLGKATARPWVYEYDEPYEASIKSNGKRIEGINVSLDDAPVREYNVIVDANAELISNLMNKADDLLDLWEACEEYETHLPNMEPVGAAKFSSQLKAAMRLRKVLEKLEGAE